MLLKLLLVYSCIIVVKKIESFFSATTEPEFHFLSQKNVLNFVIFFVHNIIFLLNHYTTIVIIAIINISISSKSSIIVVKQKLLLLLHL